MSMHEVKARFLPQSAKSMLHLRQNAIMAITLFPLCESF